MKINVFLSCFLLFCYALPDFSHQHLSSFAPGKIWPDNAGIHINTHVGCILSNEGTCWYGEHKVEGETGNNTLVSVHLYSSKDICNWKDEWQITTAFQIFRNN